MSVETFLDGRVRLHGGDNRVILKGIPDCSIDSIVTDPPYALVSIVKRFGGKNAAAVKVPESGSGAYARASSGFMGKQWDTGEVAFSDEFWAEVLRVLKPGGHVVAFSGTRTYHRMAVAIEDAGFEIRDQLGWLYGSGFPKSHDVSKGIDRAGGTPWAGFAGLLDDLIKSSGHTYASLDRALGIKSSSCYWVRTDSRGGLPPRHHYERIKSLINPPKEFTDLYDKAEREVIAIDRRKNSPSGIVSAGRESVDVERKITAPATDAAREWQGWGTALKPAWEPICLARKPLIGTVAENVLEHGTGALNIDGCRVGESGARNNGRQAGTNGIYGEIGATTPVDYGKGRWPANIIHDGSEEVIAAFPETGAAKSGMRGDQHSGRHGGLADIGGNIKDGTNSVRGIDGGSAARFFYTAKADSDDRLGSKHPTVKPVDLMQWLCRLVTPPGGTVLDPFAGTGTTGEAAFREGFKAVLIESEQEYKADIRRRMALCLSGPDERRRESIKAKTINDPVDAGPLFAGAAE